MIRQAQLPRGDENQEFRILERIPSTSERVSRDWEFSEARQAGDGTCFFRIGETANRKKHRSEEHTSELQSHLNLVCRLLLEKKKKHKPTQPDHCATLRRRLAARVQQSRS